jgi:putative exporter of polyketide antibiotics
MANAFAMIGIIIVIVGIITVLQVVGDRRERRSKHDRAA